METKQKTARETLAAVAALKLQIAHLTRRIALLESKCTGMTAQYGSKGVCEADHNELWDILSDERTRLAEQLRLVLAMEKQVSAWIDLLPRAAWRAVLRLRYLDGLSFSEVAQELSRAAMRPYSISHVYRFHRDALEAADRLWPQDRMC